MHLVPILIQPVRREDNEKGRNGRGKGRIENSRKDTEQLEICRSQSALEFCPIHCPNGCLGQDLGFGGFAFALKLPELLNTNLVTVRANIFFP